MAKRKRLVKLESEQFETPIASHELRSTHGHSGSSAQATGTVRAEVGAEDSPIVWWYGCRVVLIVAGALRFVELTLKPFHHDEGVNGFFLTSLFRDGLYKYDPSNYHGPSLYYFSLVSSWIFGLDDLAVRVVVAVFGFFTVTLVFSFRKHLGDIGTLFAAALIAVSPGLTFFSRYFIHEILLVFFSLATVVCVIKFLEGDKVRRATSSAMSLTVFVCLLPVGLQGALALSPVEDKTALFVGRFIAVAFCLGASVMVTRLLCTWDHGRPIHLFLASASASMTFTTKETSFISLGTMLIAIGCVTGWLTLTQNPRTGAGNRRLGFLLTGAGIIGLVLYFISDVPSGVNWVMDTYLLGPDKREQTLIIVGILTLFIASVETSRRYLVARWSKDSGSDVRTEAGSFSMASLVERLQSSANIPGLIFGCVLVFSAVWIVFFSSFLTNEKGIGDSFEAYNIWSKTGSSDHAQNGTWGYLRWMVGSESPILILGLVGATIAFWESKHRFAMFTSLWGFGLLAAYTIIPYKTPWIAINFVLPMALAAGYGINELIQGRTWWEPLAAKALAGLGLSICLYQCIELNFIRYDDDRRPYIYVHSKRSMNEMIEKIGEISRRAKIDDKASITVTAPEHWPLPWSLNQYKGAVFHGSLVKTPQADFIIGSKIQRADLDRDYSVTHIVAGTYELRPGVELLLYVRRELI